MIPQSKSEPQVLVMETPRLLLREWRYEDLEPFPRMNADERVCEFLGKPAPLVIQRRNIEGKM